MVLFLPFGVFVRLITHRGVVVATALGFAVSLLIEVTQLTGVWGVYPCAYRLFDVDDLLTNTLGAFLGALVSYPYAARRRRRLGTARRRLPTTVSVGRRLAGTLQRRTVRGARWHRCRGSVARLPGVRGARAPGDRLAVDDRAAGRRTARGAGADGDARRQDRRRARRGPAHDPGVVPAPAGQAARRGGSAGRPRRRHRAGGPGGRRSCWRVAARTGASSPAATAASATPPPDWSWRSTTDLHRWSRSAQARHETSRRDRVTGDVVSWTRILATGASAPSSTSGRRAAAVGGGRNNGTRAGVEAARERGHVCQA